MLLVADILPLVYVVHRWHSLIKKGGWNPVLCGALDVASLVF